MILIIDNYDSFTYNLYQYVGSINPDVQVIRNDKITPAEIKELHPSQVIISPGPGFPKDAGICTQLIRELDGKIPVLGICLGHQAIGEAYGGMITHAPVPVHGKISEVKLDQNSPLFLNLPPAIQVGRYHSLVVERETLPPELMITAETAEGLIMGVSHQSQPVFGVQFHPESVLTPEGIKIIDNFLSYRKEV
ncbi:MAG: Anthranilate synthase component 2 [Candidatus Dichloromethanomonas elyunquensis]|nr:MAG: Anthranilate synthase component 2 [Candidatus Dichloromethanomonas elyunquensis]